MVPSCLGALGYPPITIFAHVSYLDQDIALGVKGCESSCLNGIRVASGSAGMISKSMTYNQAVTYPHWLLKGSLILKQLL